MKLNTRIFALLMGMVYSFSSIAQDDYNPEFLIPYNDHGKWGFADTLGDVRVEPQFESAGFFTMRSKMGISRVQVQSAEYIYIANHGLSAPLKYETSEFYDADLLSNRLSIVKNTDGKIDIFDYVNQKLLTNVGADEYLVSSENNAIYLLSAGRIFEFSLESQELTKLRFIGMRRFAEEPYDYNCECTTYLIDRKGNWYIKDDTQWISLGKDPSLPSTDEPSNLRTMAAPPPEKELGSVESYRRHKYPEATYYSSVRCWDGAEYQVMRTKDGFGIVKEEELYLPFRYDFIDINYKLGFFILIKDKKMGVHLPTTTYSTIDPKYDFLSFDRRLKVSDSWSFVIYKIQLGENEAYLGENGVEFFNFD